MWRTRSTFYGQSFEYVFVQISSAPRGVCACVRALDCQHVLRVHIDATPASGFLCRRCCCVDSLPHAPHVISYMERVFLSCERARLRCAVLLFVCCLKNALGSAFLFWVRACVNARARTTINCEFARRWATAATRGGGDQTRTHIFTRILAHRCRRCRRNFAIDVRCFVRCAGACVPHFGRSDT